jgi:XTP/dITP diphosphohydrolase
MKILIGTTNKGKFKEISEVLSSLPIELITPDTLGITEVPVETGENYEENALIKAKFYSEKSGLTTVAEDSGIEVDALPGKLGHLTRRWGKGENATDEEWLSHFLDMMKKQENRSATFKCTAAIIHEGKFHVFHGECRGQILTEPQVALPHGIPISACFVPEGMTKVYAALSPEEKNLISHRGRAMHQVKEFLEFHL